MGRGVSNVGGTCRQDVRKILEEELRRSRTFSCPKYEESVRLKVLEGCRRPWIGYSKRR